MLETLKNVQLDLMLVICGISGAVAFFLALSKSIDKERKLYLILANLCSVLLMISDRSAYSFRGNTGLAASVIVRISNFLTFGMILMILWAFNNYFQDICREAPGIKAALKRLKVCNYIILFGLFLLFASQLTGLYYTIDENNTYHRAPGYFISIIIPVTVLIIQLTVAIQHRKNFRTGVFISLLLFTTLPIVAGLVQIPLYGLSLINLTTGFLTTMLYLFALGDMNYTVEHARQLEVDLLKKENENSKRLFAQTAEALASAIDAKDKYTKGHSSRVAEYSRKIAESVGKSSQECDEIYYAALLHDVGKIGISRSILQKPGKLSNEEYQVIKEHPDIGAQILSSISESPYLSIGARSHHERYDGKGYPQGLKGNDIPEIARIIAVADAYDAMTSSRSYRETIPQQVVREEFVKGLGTQFDPVFGKIMIHLIDLDEEYQMKEKEEVKELAGKNELICGEYRSAVSEGIVVTKEITKIKFQCVADEGFAAEKAMPSIILFDSLDARIHTEDKNITRLMYFEYGEIHFNGKIVRKGTRKMQPTITKKPIAPEETKTTVYSIEAVKVKDHVLITIDSEKETFEIIVALPDSARWAYIGLTGEHCHLLNVSIDRDDQSVPDDYIPRIAEEISYIDAPTGDLPNIQCDGYRSATTDGILVKDKVTVTFHTMSLPTARLVWHCPYFSIFSSDNGKVNGPDFREYGLLRLDGENWDSDDFGSNKITVNKTEQFTTWDDWKAINKEGFDCSITIERSGDKVTLTTSNKGIEIVNVTTMKDPSKEVYISLTGDQCAITNIKIKDS